MRKLIAGLILGAAFGYYTPIIMEHKTMRNELEAVKGEMMQLHSQCMRNSHFIGNLHSRVEDLEGQFKHFRPKDAIKITIEEKRK